MFNLANSIQYHDMWLKAQEKEELSGFKISKAAKRTCSNTEDTVGPFNSLNSVINYHIISILTFK